MAPRPMHHVTIRSPRRSRFGTPRSGQRLSVGGSIRGAEQARRVLVVSIAARQPRQTLDDIGQPQKSTGVANTKASRASRSACSGSPWARAMWARAISATTLCQPGTIATVSSAHRAGRD